MSDLELCDDKTTMIYLFFIQIDKISIFWLTTDNFHFRKLFSGALMFFFLLIIGDFSKELLKTVTLLEKSGIVWSHMGLETFQRSNCKGLWERNKWMCPPQPELSPFESKIVLLTSIKPLCSAFSFCYFVLTGSFVCFIRRFCLCTQPSLRELSHSPF